MPVSIGNDLSLNNNKLSATYNSLYERLNRACAWEYNEIITSEYSYVMMNNSGSTMNIHLIGASSEEPYLGYCGGIDSNIFTYILINGKVYRGSSFTQVGTNSNYKAISNAGFIDTDGYAYTVSGVKGSNNILFDKINKRGGGGIGIDKTGKLYKGTLTTVTSPYDSGSTGWTDCCSEYDTKYYAIQNGIIYNVRSATKKQIFSDVNNFVKVYSDDDQLIGLTSDGKVYYCSSGTSPTSSNCKLIYENIMTLFPTSSTCNFYAMSFTGDFMYCSYSSTSIPPYKILSSGINFTSMTRSYNYNSNYAIGDNKLYYINGSNSPILLDGNHYYFKIEGCESFQVASRLETDPIINNRRIRYTTRYSDIGDNLYTDTTPSSYEKILDKTPTTLLSSGGGLTYTRNASLDSSFKNTLPEYKGKTLTVEEFIMMTNPNN